jgi:diguanylate cyclase (GGDEF)-like protein/PAS domain S-box-containing protein
MKDDASVRELLSRIDSGVYFLDLDKKIVFWNRAAERLTGYPKERVLNTRCSDNLLRHVTPDGVELCVSGCPLAATMSDRVVREAEVYMHCSDGSRQPIAVYAAPLTDDSDAVIGAVEIFSDRRDLITILSELENLRQEVLTDPLSGLGNRRLLGIMAEFRFTAMRQGAAGFGLFIVDIDHFKEVNDAYGHAAGDKALKMVAFTLTQAVRPLDAVVRWGGDEFILLCPNVSSGNLEALAERIRVLVERCWVELDGGKNLCVTISIGTARAFPDDTLESVVARADARLYEAKSHGRNRCAVGD